LERSQFSGGYKVVTPDNPTLSELPYKLELLGKTLAQKKRCVVKNMTYCIMETNVDKEKKNI
jgi:hypothetical protein